MSARKKVDNRIRIAIENGVALRRRTMFVVVGDKGKDQVVILHHMLSKSAVKARPTVLWCYKKELGFSSHRKKRIRQIQKKIKTKSFDVSDDPFQLFIASTNIRYCYYKETHKILGNTYGMCVLQDFEAVTPNLLARTIETVEGGGIIVILLRSVSSLKQLYTLSMDVHSRYRTESHQEVTGRFNERFLLSLASCSKCLVIDDALNVLPLSSKTLSVKAVTHKEEVESRKDVELRELRDSLSDTQPVGSIINLCKTLDQAKAVLQFIEAISEKTLRSTVALTASRGRGKSAALGLAIAGAVAFGYSSLFVTSPSPENLKTLFEFIFKGFDALEYQEHLDYDIVQSTNPEFNQAVVRVNVFREHRQTIQYIHPSDSVKLGQAELVVIDEAAAIPLPLVRNLLGPYLVFMSSTINGYEGTGRSLSLKLIDQLRKQSQTATVTGRLFREVTLNEPIRYADGDDVEKWLHHLLCLNISNVPKITTGCPPPKECQLYYVNRDTLFSYHKASETFLQLLMSLYVASHYKNSPNDLQLLSDAPAHHVFCLLGPVHQDTDTLPDILCVIQVCLEGEVSKASVINSLSRGKRSSGDLIPWTISQQFQDPNFAGLSGLRVVRIATHPDLQRMGYGSRALELLRDYYEGLFPSVSESAEVELDQKIDSTLDQLDGGSLLTERLHPRADLPPLLLKLTERRPERIDYMGVSYGLSPDLLRFWKKAGFTPVYLRQTPNDLTGEHSCIMLRVLRHDSDEETTEKTDWLAGFSLDFRRRFLSLLSYQFTRFSPSLGFNILDEKKAKANPKVANMDELKYHFTTFDVRRLDMYAKNMADYHLIMDLLPPIAQLYFRHKLGSLKMSAVQAVILLGMGLQHKSVETIEKELDVPSSQILGLFNRTIRKVVQFLSGVVETAIGNELSLPEIPEMAEEIEPLKISMDEELTAAAEELKKKQQAQLEELQSGSLDKYAIAGSEGEWQEIATTTSVPNVVSIKRRGQKRDKGKEVPGIDDSAKKPKKKKKQRS